MSTNNNDDSDIKQIPNKEKLTTILSPREFAAYSFLQKSPNKPAPLTQIRKTQLFSLFLEGMDCTEIARLNNGISLAQIVTVRIEDHWDDLRQQHQEDLAKNIRERHLQSSMKSIEFLTLALAVAHRKFGDAMKKYIETGDETHLAALPAAMRVDDLSNYKKVAELLKNITTPPDTGKEDDIQIGNKVWDSFQRSNEPSSETKALAAKDVIAKVVQIQRTKNEKA